MEFTHFDEQGNARMVDVTAKGETVREAVARGRIRVSGECFEKIQKGTMAKGDVLGVARIAGIMGAKRTSELIPLCHILNLTKLNVDFTRIRKPARLRQSAPQDHRQDRCGDGSADRSVGHAADYLRYVQGRG